MNKKNQEIEDKKLLTLKKYQKIKNYKQKL